MGRVPESGGSHRSIKGRGRGRGRGGDAPSNAIATTVSAGGRCNSRVIAGPSPQEHSTAGNTAVQQNQPSPRNPLPIALAPSRPHSSTRVYLRRQRVYWRPPEGEQSLGPGALCRRALGAAQSGPAAPRTAHSSHGPNRGAQTNAVHRQACTTATRTNTHYVTGRNVPEGEAHYCGGAVRHAHRGNAQGQCPAATHSPARGRCPSAPSPLPLPLPLVFPHTERAGLKKHIRKFAARRRHRAHRTTGTAQHNRTAQQRTAQNSAQLHGKTGLCRDAPQERRRTQGYRTHRTPAGGSRLPPPRIWPSADAQTRPHRRARTARVSRDAAMLCRCLTVLCRAVMRCSSVVQHTPLVVPLLPLASRLSPLAAVTPSAPFALPVLLVLMLLMLLLLLLSDY